MKDVVDKPTREHIDAAADRMHRGAGRATESGPDAENGPSVPLDREAFEQQRATFGDERILRFLAMLAEELERRRIAIGDSVDRGARAELAQHAHAIASAAGNLGYCRLMNLGRALERNSGTLPPPELALALDEFQGAMTAATASIATLLIELDCPTPGPSRRLPATRPRDS